MLLHFIYPSSWPARREKVWVLWSRCCIRTIVRMVTHKSKRFAHSRVCEESAVFHGVRRLMKAVAQRRRVAKAVG